jgi:hypothetical protein
MRSAALLGVAGTALLVGGEVRSSDRSAPEMLYCSNVGPVIVRVDGRHFSASYRIAKANIEGSVVGLIHGNMATANWKDPDGRGRIYFFFSQDRSRFTTAYNNDRRPTAWFGPWIRTRVSTPEC